MTLNIKHPEADRLARALAHIMHQNITAVIIGALKEKLMREEGKLHTKLKDDILTIGQRCSKLPNIDKRTPEQIMGYNKHGIPR